MTPRPLSPCPVCEAPVVECSEFWGMTRIACPSDVAHADTGYFGGYATVRIAFRYCRAAWEKLCKAASERREKA